jgi:hypothetical protein
VSVDLADELQELWRRYWHLAAARVATLEALLLAHDAGASDADLLAHGRVADAVRAAHSLRGSLDSYGRWGSAAAGDIEELLAGPPFAWGPFRLLLALIREEIEERST